jgi:integrase
MKCLSLTKAVEFYLQQRRQLGFALKEDGQMLRQLVGYASQRGHRGSLTTKLALAWAQAPVGASRLWWARRLDAARRFASFWRAFDPRTELPPVGVLGPSYRRRAVHLYTPQQIATLMQAASQLGGLRGLSFQALIGLLACTVLRIGEALRLQQQDIDWAAARLMVRHSKCGRSRCLPLHLSTLSALKLYHQRQQTYYPSQASFLLGRNGRAIGYAQAAATFRSLRERLGWNQEPVPRLHDLRHTFAVRCLIEGYRQGEDMGQKVLCLATYLGHSNLNGTYWYLSAIPELLSLAQTRWTERQPTPGGSRG